MSEPTTTQTPARKLIGARVGLVTSDRRQKTRTVVIEYQARHPKYGKYIRRRTKVHVHDPNNESHNGDRVEVAQCRPTSKTKSWRLVRVITKAPKDE